MGDDRHHRREDRRGYEDLRWNDDGRGHERERRRDSHRRDDSRRRDERDRRGGCYRDDVAYVDSYDRDRRRRDERIDRDRRGLHRDDRYRDGDYFRRRDDSRSRRAFREDDRRRRDDYGGDRSGDYPRKRGRDDDWGGDDRRAGAPPANAGKENQRGLSGDRKDEAAPAKGALEEDRWSTKMSDDEDDEDTRRKRSKWDEGGKPDTAPADLPDWLQDLAAPTPGLAASGMRVPQGIRQFKQLKLPAKQRGGLIGTGGETIKFIRKASGADIKIKFNPGDEYFFVLIHGNVEHVEQLIEQKLAESGSGWTAKILYDMPQDLVSQTIGSGGKHLKEIGANTGCKLEFMDSTDFDPTAEPLKVCRIRGPPQQIPVAEQLLRLKVIEVQRLDKLKREGKLTGRAVQGPIKQHVPTYRDVLHGVAKGDFGTIVHNSGTLAQAPLVKLETGPADNLYEGYGAEELLLKSEYANAGQPLLNNGVQSGSESAEAWDTQNKSSEWAGMDQPQPSQWLDCSSPSWGGAHHLAFDAAQSTQQWNGDVSQSSHWGACDGGWEGGGYTGGVESRPTLGSASMVGNGSASSVAMVGGTQFDPGPGSISLDGIVGQWNSGGGDESWGCGGLAAGTNQPNVLPFRPTTPGF